MSKVSISTQELIEMFAQADHRELLNVYLILQYAYDSQKVLGEALLKLREMVDAIHSTRELVKVLDRGLEVGSQTSDPTNTHQKNELKLNGKDHLESMPKSADSASESEYHACRFFLARTGIFLVRVQPGDGLEGYFATDKSGWQYLPSIEVVKELIRKQTTHSATV